VEFIDQGKTVQLDGHQLPKLSPNDRRKLMVPLKAERRASLKENLIAGGITGQAFVNEMDAFDQMEFGDYEFFSFLRTTEGRAAVIELACGKAGGNAAEVLDMPMPVGEDFKLAAMLAGVTLVEKTEGDAKGDTPDRPSVAGS
jgi:hypothetical protein